MIFTPTNFEKGCINLIPKSVEEQKDLAFDSLIPDDLKRLLLRLFYFISTLTNLRTFYKHLVQKRGILLVLSSKVRPLFGSPTGLPLSLAVDLIMGWWLIQGLERG